MVETLDHQYTYIPDIPMQQASTVGYVNVVMEQTEAPHDKHVNGGTGLAVARHPEDHQYENVGGNYPRLYSTPIQETNFDQ